MPQSLQHTQWFVDTGNRLQTEDGKHVEVWEFNHCEDEHILSTWAKHFRNHYCLDEDIDFLRNGTQYSRNSDYLTELVFPDIHQSPGPSIRAGDFGEILVADFLEYLSGFWVPRTRYVSKTIRNESTKGTDIIGFKFVEDDNISPNDILAIFEAKARFASHSNKPRLDEDIFFVPRVIEQIKLERKPRERDRFFPEKENGNSIALYLGFKLVEKGSVAIFCGPKKAASSSCRSPRPCRSRRSLSPPL